MKKVWNQLSLLSRYYIISMIGFFICWSIFSILKVEFLNTLFFIMSYIWHFTLLTPGLKDKMLTSRQRFSFINVVVRINYYLQLFIKLKKISFGPSIVRAISPMLFSLLLILVGGSGNLLFTLLGSICFEATHYFLTNKKSISVPPGDSEIPPATPIVRNSHE
ncbi:MAG: hypothetical protein Q7T57_06375 [Dehalococcoidales bacterium]|nr:hypothetical protein [Dehalococcoidales bacterium]